MSDYIVYLMADNGRFLCPGSTPDKNNFFPVFASKEKADVDCKFAMSIDDIGVTLTLTSLSPSVARGANLAIVPNSSGVMTPNPLETGKMPCESFNYDFVDDTHTLITLMHNKETYLSRIQEASGHAVCAVKKTKDVHCEFRVIYLAS